MMSRGGAQRAFLLLALAGLGLFSVPGQAQLFNEPFDPFGQVFSAVLRPAIPDPIQLRAEISARQGVFAISPGFRYQNDGWVASLSGAYANTLPRGNDYRFSVSYSSFNPDQGDQLDLLGLSGGLQVLAGEKVNASVIGAYSRIVDVFDGVTALVTVDHEMSNRITASYNVGWSQLKPDVGGKIDDFQPAVGVVLKLDPEGR